jgi:hypothetical protein
MSGLYFEGDSFFGFGSGGVLVHDVLIWILDCIIYKKLSKIIITE